VTLFRPCIDLHQGAVKQIVGSTLSIGAQPTTNFVSAQSAGYFSALYRNDGLKGGHVIQLGQGNEHAAEEALSVWPQGLQLGGGVNAENARHWLDRGAAKVIVTSYLFEAGSFSYERLLKLRDMVSPEELVIDLSCRRKDHGWVVATDRWQTLTDLQVDARSLEQLARSCSEFLIHAVDVEGLCQGIDEELVTLLGRDSPLPCTYAGGGRSLSDLEKVEELSDGRIDLTFGSALDLFGGRGVRYADCVAWNQSRGLEP
jgi:phosphoribosylformimino-5-aminoimidazole carboxamide ribotide isomerase